MSIPQRIPLHSPDNLLLMIRLQVLLRTKVPRVVGGIVSRRQLLILLVGILPLRKIVLRRPSLPFWEFALFLLSGFGLSFLLGVGPECQVRKSRERPSDLRARYSALAD